jgi:hypothetical protein
MNPYDKDGPRRLETVGFRLAISAPVVTSKDRLEKIEAEWQALPEVESALTGTERLEDPLEEMTVLIDAARDPAFRDRLKDLRTVMRANIVTRNEQRDRAARNLLRFGVIMAQRILDSDAIRDAKSKALAALKPVYAADNPIIVKVTAELGAANEAVETNAGHYRDTIVELLRDYPPSIIETQARVLKEELNARSMSALGPIADTFEKHVARFRKDGKLPSDTIINELK